MLTKVAIVWVNANCKFAKKINKKAGDERFGEGQGKGDNKPQATDKAKIDSENAKKALEQGASTATTQQNSIAKQPTSNAKQLLYIANSIRPIINELMSTGMTLDQAMIHPTIVKMVKTLNEQEKDQVKNFLNRQ